MPAWPVNRGPTCATFKKPWATPHPPSPPTSIATSTQTNSTRSPPTSTDSTRPKRSVQRSPDKNRTKRTNDRVHKPCSYRSERWSRLGSNQRPSACEADALPLSHGTGAERRTTSKTSTRRPLQNVTCGCECRAITWKRPVPRDLCGPAYVDYRRPSHRATISSVARGCSAVGSASPCQGEGRGFESRHPLEGASGINPSGGVAEW
jgi:hypothetical protein